MGEGQPALAKRMSQPDQHEAGRTGREVRSGRQPRNNSESGHPGTGRRRSKAKSKDAILQAAFAQLEAVGVRGMTVEGVASNAGVAKTTIYRWWRSKGVLALDAYEHGMGMLEPTHPADTGSFVGDLKELVRPVVEERGRVSQRLVAQIIAEAQYDSELAGEIHSKVIAPYRRLQQSIFERASARREIPPSLDTEMLLDALYGAYFHRLLFHHGDLDAAFFDSLVELLVDGATARTKATRNAPTGRR